MQPPQRSDENLLRSGRTADFAVVYRRHVEAVWSFCRSRSSAEDAADLTSEVFAQALLSRRRFRGRGRDSARPWLLGIARNLLRHHARHNAVAERARHRIGLDPTTAPDDVEAAVVRRLDLPAEAQRANEAIAQLPPTLADAVRLRILEERPYDQVARELGCSPAAARVRVSRGLQQLATHIGATTWS